MTFSEKDLERQTARFRNDNPYVNLSAAQTCTQAGGVTTGEPVTGAPDGKIWCIREGNAMPIPVNHANQVRVDMVGTWVEIGDRRGTNETDIIRVLHTRNVEKYGAVGAIGAQQQPTSPPEMTKPRHNYTATSAPTVTDDENSAPLGYSTNSLWVNVSTNIAYICVDAAAGAAVWQVIGGMTSFTLAGDTGTSAITDGNTLTVAGGASNGIDTSVSGDTVTVALDTGELTEEKAVNPLLDSLPYRDNSAGAERRIEFIDLLLPYIAESNLIINGGLERWQRGTTFAAAADGAYSADRWRWGQSGAGVVTLNQSTNLPTAAENATQPQFSYEVDVTTADASIGATDRYTIEQRIEGYDARTVVNRFVALSFWVMSPKTGTHCVAFRNSGADRCYIAEYTISVADTWEYKTVLVETEVPTAGTWNYTNGVGLTVAFSLAMGSNFHGTANTWNTSNVFATSNQVNCLDNAANFFRIWGVDVRPGKIAVPYFPRKPGRNLQLCQRYYHKTYEEATALATATSLGGQTGYAASTTTIPHHSAFPTEMRAVPTVVFYSTSGTINQVRDSSVGADVGTGAITALNASTKKMFSISDSGAPFTAGNLHAWQYTAVAEL